MSDEALIIEKARGGSMEAFGELMGLYKKAVYNLCFRMLGDREDADDACQEAFIKMYKGLKTYNGQHKFSTWALKVASNTCIDFIRKRKMQTVPIEDYDIGSGTTPEKSYMADETRKDIKAAINSLPEKYRIMVVYYHFMNLSYQEISTMLNEPMTIVKNRLYRARVMLKENLFEREGGYDGLQDSI